MERTRARSQVVRWALGVGLLASVVSPLRAQREAAPSVARQSSAGSSIFTVQRSTPSDGLPGISVHAIYVGDAGQIWLGTDGGIARRISGRWWEPLRIPADPDERLEIRGLLVCRSGAIWAATRWHGVWSYEAGKWTHYGPAEGVATEETYSLTETRAVDGQWRVIVGQRLGASYFDGTRFRALATPEGFTPFAIVAADGRAKDGSPMLWLASASDGLVSLHAGTWERHDGTRGLRAKSVESIVATIPGDSVLAYAAGYEGVFSFDGARWQLVPGAPKEALRVTDVQTAGGGRELWVGARTGALWRRDAGGHWSSHQIDEIQRDQITAMASGRTVAGDGVVYVGMRGSGLSRISITGVVRVAALPEHEPGYWNLSLDTDGKTPVAAYSLDQVARLRDLSLAPIATTKATTNATTNGGGRDIGMTRSYQGALWAGTSAGVYRLDGRTWRNESAGLPADVPVQIQSLRAGTGPTAKERLFALVGDDLFERTGASWTTAPHPAWAGPRASAAPTAPGGGDELWIPSSNGLYRLHGTTWERATGLGPARLTERRPLIAGVVGHDTVVVTSVREGIVAARLRDLPGGWKIVVKAQSGVVPSSLAIVGHSVLVGTNRAVYCYHPGADITAAWPLHDRIGQADGLPVDEVWGMLPYRNGLLVSTPSGLAFIPQELRSDAMPGPGHLTLAIRADGRSDVVDGEDVPERSGSLYAQASLATQHREDDTEYRFDVMGPEAFSSGWRPIPQIGLRSLRAGDYAIEVRARDWRGHEYPPVRRQLRVLAVWWKTKPMVGVYLLLVLLSVAYLMRRSERTLRTRAKAAEEAAQARAESEERIRALFDASRDAHLLVSANDRVEFANPVATSLGLARTSLGSASPALAALAKRDGPGDWATMGPDGEPRIFEVSAAVVSVRGEAMTHLALRDVTEVRHAEQLRDIAEERLQAAQRLEALGTLAGGIAHDFNNLLSIVSLNTEMAVEEDDPKELRILLEAVLAATNRARGIVRKLLTVGRPQAPSRSLVRLPALLQDLMPVLRSSVPSSVVLECVVPAAEGAVLADRGQLEQVLINLAANAEHAMRGRQNPRLEIRVEDVLMDDEPAHALGLVPGSYVRVQVADTGVGIPASYLARVLEPFFTTKPAGEGTGLGLSMVNGIMRAHGGTLTVQSVEGEGTTVTLWFPEAPADERAASSTPPAGSRAVAAGGRGERIAVVDDETAVAEATARQLRRLGYVVDVFTDPVVARERLSSAAEPPALLLTDQTMPRLAGDQLASALREKMPTLPVIVTTGNPLRFTPTMRARLPGIIVLEKPVPTHALAETIRVALDATIAV
jgi:signal transduction histidine kinase/CheY-like chemotaxis protein/ligand-binding sensor domain-containing protein